MPTAQWQRYKAFDQIRRQHLERLEYEANMAKRRYVQVDPDNGRLADTLFALVGHYPL